MSTEVLKNWMQQTGMTVVDIASRLSIDPDTVRRYLKTGRAHRSTLEAYKRLVNSMPVKAAAG
jgi:predicted site-specific integrase-resolvase